MVEFKIIYLLLFVVAIFLLYHLGSCYNGLVESFSVGGQNKINISNLLSLSYIPECNPPPPPPPPPPCTDRDYCNNKGTASGNESNCSCKCNDGWTGNNCDKVVDPCNPNPCKNYGVCKEGGHCLCINDWSGPTCEIPPPPPPPGRKRLSCCNRDSQCQEGLYCDWTGRGSIEKCVLKGEGIGTCLEKH